MRLQALHFPSHERYQDKDESSYIALPEDILHQILSDFDETEIEYPMIFKLFNPENNASTYACAYEFSVYGSQCYIPQWMFVRLGIDPRSPIEILKTHSRVPKGSKIVIEPMEESFWRITNYKEALELAFSSYSVLQKGDTVDISVDGKTFQIKILETSPEDVIGILDCDLEIEFRSRSGEEGDGDLDNSQAVHDAESEGSRQVSDKEHTHASASVSLENAVTFTQSVESLFGPNIVIPPKAPPRARPMAAQERDVVGTLEEDTLGTVVPSKGFVPFSGKGHRLGSE